MIKEPSSSWECLLALWLDGKNLTSAFWFVLLYNTILFETVILIPVLFYCACCFKWKEFLVYILRGWKCLHVRIWCCRWSVVEDHKLCTWLVGSPKLAARKNNAGNGIIVIVCAAFIVNHYDWSRSRFWRWTPPTACDPVVRKARWTPTTQETAPRESGPGDRWSSFCFCWFCSWPFLICSLLPCCPIGLCIVFSYFSGGQVFFFLFLFIFLSWGDVSTFMAFPHLSSCTLLSNWDLVVYYCQQIQGGFFNWPSPENVSRLAPPKFAWTGPP